jgi:hypothetical protein
MAPRSSPGIAPGAGAGWTGGSPDPPAAPRSPIPGARLLMRAQTWHAGQVGPACECWPERYPCPTCARQIGALAGLLDGVVRDTIRAITVAMDRLT